jgi:Mn2+/Fe2+ NRAMP family transporter
LHTAGLNNIESAADAAKALEPLAGVLAKALFVIGIVGVGVLAFPVMTIGAAYDLAQGMRKRNTLNAEPRQAPFFYGTIAVVTAAAVALNFFDFNPMHALVWSGIVQGFSVPPLLLLIMLITSSDKLMLGQPNGMLVNIIGWLTTAVTFGATICLVATWILP